MNMVENSGIHAAQATVPHRECFTSVDMEAEIEKLMLKASQKQKNVASRLTTAYRKEKTKALEKSFSNMQYAGDWKIAGSIFNVVLKMGAAIMAHYCGDDTGVVYKTVMTAVDAGGDNNALGFKIDGYNLEAQKEKSAADVSAMHSSDHAQWIKDTRSLESRMLERLESMETKRHEEKKIVNGA